MDEVTVITLTRERPDMVKRAIASVQKQKCEYKIHHLVLVDDCQQTKEMFEKSMFDNPNLVWKYFPREPGDCSGPGRSAVLRNIGVEISQSRWICFLDDDNEYEPDHIRSLVRCILHAGSPVAHSYMNVFYRDGRPYICEDHPWELNGMSTKESYKWLVKKGVRIPGSNVFRDRGDTLDTPDPVRTVDTNEFLFEKEILLRFPFTVEYSADDLDRMQGEDDKLLGHLIENGIRLACTENASVRYYLGGYSNRIE